MSTDTSCTPIVADAAPEPTLRWKIVHAAQPTFGWGAEIGLFRDGIRVAAYRKHEHAVTVKQHLHGEDRCHRTLTVATVTDARRVCLQLADGTYPPADEGRP